MCIRDREGLTLSPETILTPHPAEAARLLHCSTDEVRNNPLIAAQNIGLKYQATVLLKGSESVVSRCGGACTIVHEGDATLSAGGTGDVLAGLVAAYLAQGLSSSDAAMLGAFVHGRAGKGLGLHSAQRGVTAREIASNIPKVVSQLALVWKA